MHNRLSFERGRNDRRDGKPAEFMMQTPNYINKLAWLAGWSVQENIAKSGKYAQAFADGRKAQKNGESEMSNPHPKGTSSYNSWYSGWISANYH